MPEEGGLEEEEVGSSGIGSREVTNECIQLMGVATDVIPSQHGF